MTENSMQDKHTKDSSSSLIDVLYESVLRGAPIGSIPFGYRRRVRKKAFHEMKHGALGLNAYRECFEKSSSCLLR